MFQHCLLGSTLYLSKKAKDSLLIVNIVISTEDMSVLKQEGNEVQFECMNFCLFGIMLSKLFFFCIITAKECILTGMQPS